MQNNQNGNSSEQVSDLKYLSRALRTIAQEMQIRSEILKNPRPLPFEHEASIMTG